MPLAVTFPLSGQFRDLHPLEYVRAGRTKAPEPQQLRFRGFKIFICKILHHTAFRHCRNCRSRFRDIGDTALGGEEHAGY